MTETKFPALHLYARISINRSLYFLDHRVVSFILFSIFFFVCLSQAYLRHTLQGYSELSEEAGLRSQGSWEVRPSMLIRAV